MEEHLECNVVNGGDSHAAVAELDREEELRGLAVPGASGCYTNSSFTSVQGQRGRSNKR